jgi:hypothetical protein
MEIDHIDPKAEGGEDSEENAIPVCFECHAEIHSYNDKHPKGRKFRADEIRGHKEQWLKICRERPELFVNVAWDIDVGPLSALIDEMEFNLLVATKYQGNEIGCMFKEEQFLRAIGAGAVAILKEDLKYSILDAYRVMNRANQFVLTWISRNDVNLQPRAIEEVSNTLPKIEKARKALLQFLQSES